MPTWAGKWKGGRYYLDDAGKPVFFIERLRRTIKVKTQDPDLALGELSRFLQDPAGYVRPTPLDPSAVWITKERVTLYLESIRESVKDHKNARLSYLHDWAQKKLDLRTATRNQLRAALSEFEGGHHGRVEALNAFARFLVREGDLLHWNPLKATRDPEHTRAERVAYSIEEIEERYRTLATQRMKDVLLVRVCTGMHHTEIQQLEKCKVYSGPLPDVGAGVRVLAGDHEIKGVLQVRQKTKPRHRISVSADVLTAAMRLREGVPTRVSVWKFFAPMVPSNLRHTYITLAGEMGRTVSYKTSGASLDQIQQAVGHRIGSKVTLSSYDKLQIPPAIFIPVRVE